MYLTLGTMLGSVALALILLGFDFGGPEDGGQVGVGRVKANDDGVAKLPVMGYNSTCGSCWLGAQWLIQHGCSLECVRCGYSLRALRAIPREAELLCYSARSARR